MELSRSAHACLLAVIALAGAAGVHFTYRAAEAWAARRRGHSRDHVMLPALLVFALALAVVADWLGDVDPTLLQQGGFALFLGLAIGQRLPRPRRLKRPPSQPL